MPAAATKQSDLVLKPSGPGRHPCGRTPAHVPPVASATRQARPQSTGAPGAGERPAAVLASRGTPCQVGRSEPTYTTHERRPGPSPLVGLAQHTPAGCAKPPRLTTLCTRHMWRASRLQASLHKPQPQRLLTRSSQPGG